MNKLLLIVIAAILLLAGMIYRDHNRQLNEPNQTGGADLTGISVMPYSLGRLVETSSAIVVARYVEATDQVTVTLATAEPLSGAPDAELLVVYTEVVVDEVLKDDGDIEVNDHVAYGTFGKIPVGLSEVSQDAASSFPILWPVDTEFILFMNRETGVTEYYIPYSECGRVVTDGETVTCSDGNRSELEFMTELSREDFINAVVDEVENPSATATPHPTVTPEPTETPTPTRTPTPCAGLGC